ncbi:UNVERIFIED_CONTAM: Retrovirus-related Pol polyprotein from transposon TNT 1-94 [Sesamum radiatum]|uniref:Retrovirus-related Pol polyprotein from transposon TNT 1-94 n=1 Tax=Sesamum radiatum TaxID=300843 RepID=A0AAW2QHG8_SESRA
MHNANPVDTPMDKSCVLSKKLYPKTEEEKKCMTKIPYASAVGSLMYAMMRTRPDLCFAVGMVSRYQNNPEPNHWVAVKRILKYLKGTSDLALCYHGESLRLVGYSDADGSRDRDERKSTLGYAFYWEALRCYHLVQQEVALHLFVYHGSRIYCLYISSPRSYLVKEIR